MSPVWGLPFVGMILSVALLPALVPRLWHRGTAAVVAIWSLALLLPWALSQGAAATGSLLRAAVLDDYLPFISLIAALYVTGGGVLLRGGPFGRPLGNVLLLGSGCLLAGLIGTSGASLILIHPLLQANAHRQHKFHLVLFFIVLVANAGGALSPLGPPLFLGLLAGVPFFWPLRHLGPIILPFAGLLLALFYLIDRHLAARDPPAPRLRLHLHGLPNLLLMAVAVASVGLPHLYGAGLCGLVMLVSLLGTPKAVRQSNMWGPAPLIEVATLFAGLFITMQPMIRMLQQGAAGPLAPLLKLANGPATYFWVAGWLSAFLDNAPTYQLLFNAAGGDPLWLSGAGSHNLAAIAAGSVLFGALTYIGNAPNMMIQSIAAHRGVRMPGFFGYFAWAALLLLPLLWLIQKVFF